MAIKIVRFTDGLDVICDCEFTSDDMIEIIDPMLFEIRGVNLLLQVWLPMAVVKHNSVMIGMENILCVMDPTEDFEEYYINTVTKLNEESKKEKEVVLTDEVLSAFEEKEFSKNSLMH
jgi:hypothetical protein